MAPSCDPVFRALALSARAPIVDVYASIKNGPFDEAAVTTRIREWEASLTPFIEADPNRTVRDFHKAVDTLV